MTSDRWAIIVRFFFCFGLSNFLSVPLYCAVSSRSGATLGRNTVRPMDAWKRGGVVAFCGRVGSRAGRRTVEIMIMLRLEF